VLNFTSARKLGGGCLRGAKGQEEDLARSSGLYRSLKTQPEFYAITRVCSSPLYTDYMFYSPNVPWFRGGNRELLCRTFLASVRTAPAPNVGEYLRKAFGDYEKVRNTLFRRAGYILTAAKMFGPGSLLLGAWGCGVFRNSPEDVAGAFKSHLKSRHFKDCFDRVEFAVFDSTKSQRTLNTFRIILQG